MHLVEQALGKVVRLVKATPHAIYCDEEGKFYALVGEEWRCSKNIADVEKLARDFGRKYIEAFSKHDLNRSSNGKLKATKIGGRDDSYLVTLSGQKIYGDKYLYDEKLIADLEALSKEQREADFAFQAREDKLMKRAVEITAKNVEALLKKHGKEARPTTKPKKKK